MVQDEIHAYLCAQTSISFSGTFDQSSRDLEAFLESEAKASKVTGNPFEVVSLDDICNASPSSSVRSRFGQQFFLRIGTWRDETWTMSLGGCL